MTRLSNLADGTDSNSDDLKAEVTFRTTIRDMFLSIAQALLYLAPLNSTTLLTAPFGIVDTALTVAIAVSFWRVERRTGSFLNNVHLVKVLAGLPRVMLRVNRFSAADIRLIVDSEDVGNGFIIIPAVIPSFANVSVSRKIEIFVSTFSLFFLLWWDPSLCEHWRFRVSTESDGGFWSAVYPCR